MSGFHWIASYPKSGNTWLRLALASLLGDGAPLDFANLDVIAPIASDCERFEAVIGVESTELTAAEILALRPAQYEMEARTATAPLLRKVHDAWITLADGTPLFPPSCAAAAVYIARDPRDVALSWASHLAITPAAAIRRMNDPAATLAPRGARGGRQLEQLLLRWSDHVASWIDAARPRPLLLRYEDMLADPLATLRAVASHLGLHASELALQGAVAASRFSVLQAEEDRVGFREKPIEAARFFRRGVAGAWRDELPQDLVAEIEQAHGEKMARLGYL